MGSAPGGLHAQGKVRDLYEAGPQSLLLVASDRLSAFDVVLPNPVPDKGRVLTGLSLHWFDRTKDLVGNHLLTADRHAFPAPFALDEELAGRAMLVRRAQVVPMECVARGYLSGSGWKEYGRSGTVCGIGLPQGWWSPTACPNRSSRPPPRRRGSRPPARAPGRGGPRGPRTVRAAEGAVAGDLRADRGPGRRSRHHPGRHEVRVRVLRGRADPDRRGLAPDSSRFWPADAYEPGHAQPSFDKQYVRDWLDASGWDHEPPPPELPQDVVERTAQKYREAYERITGEPFERTASGWV